MAVHQSVHPVMAVWILDSLGKMPLMQQNKSKYFHESKHARVSLCLAAGFLAGLVLVAAFAGFFLVLSSFCASLLLPPPTACSSSSSPSSSSSSPVMGTWFGSSIFSSSSSSPSSVFLLRFVFFLSLFLTSLAFFSVFSVFSFLLLSFPAFPSFSSLSPDDSSDAANLGGKASVSSPWSSKSLRSWFGSLKIFKIRNLTRSRLNNKQTASKILCCTDAFGLAAEADDGGVTLDVGGGVTLLLGLSDMNASRRKALVSCSDIKKTFIWDMILTPKKSKRI